MNAPFRHPPHGRPMLGRNELPPWPWLANRLVAESIPSDLEGVPVPNPPSLLLPSIRPASLPVRRLAPFGALEPFGADLIAIDPPWLYKLRSAKGAAKSPQAHYRCLRDEQIMALPVELLASEGCWIFVWATAPKLDVAMACLKAWRFTYKTTISWRKTTINGRAARGCGFIQRSMTEHILIGAIGKPVRGKPLDGLFDGVRREHSRKPEEFYERIESFAPRARKLDLFSRQSRPGWTTWGNEKTKFDAQPIEAAS